MLPARRSRLRPAMIRGECPGPDRKRWRSGLPVPRGHGGDVGRDRPQVAISERRFAHYESIRVRSSEVRAAASRATVEPPTGLAGCDGRMCSAVRVDDAALIRVRPNDRSSRMMSSTSVLQLLGDIQPRAQLRSTAGDEPEGHGRLERFASAPISSSTYG
mgnify:CR=1 FL=1